jgi:prolyl-tRNA synthetase
MKDLYSYSLDEKQHQAFYDSVIEAYLRIFERIGIGDKTFLTYASGGAFTKFSHEFQTLTPAGEDVIYLNREKRLAINQEVYNDEVIKHLKLNRADMEQLKASEVGNIFSFGTVKSEQLDLSYTSKSGDKQYVVIGSYGIGITRLIGVITELFADQKGLVWPEAIAPYKVHLIRIGHSDALTKKADKLYKLLTDSKIEVIYDDRDLRVGEMLKDADLLGIPHRVVVSDKGLANNTLEWKKRTDSEAKIINEAELVSILES